MPCLTISPQDLLFFRDSRPMEPGIGSGGYGANWPNPSVIFGALQAALHRSGLTACEERNGRKFTTLKTAGPFPAIDDEWHFTAPADLVSCEQQNYRVLQPAPEEKSHRSHLSSKELAPVFNPAKASKQSVPNWFDKKGIELWLQGKVGSLDPHAKEDNDFFTSDWITGIGTDPSTGTQDGERIYSAEYLRLRDEVGLAMHATLEDKQSKEHLDSLFNSQNIIIVGGQQRACRVTTSHASLSDKLPMSISIDECRHEDGRYFVSWLLLTPAIFPAIEDHPGGWLPNWIDHENNQVLLKIIAPGERQARRKSKNEVNRGNQPTHQADDTNSAEIDATLTAATLQGPQNISSWKQHLRVPDSGDSTETIQAPSPTLLAAAAGSVYYFTCRGREEAGKLIEAISWHDDQGRIAHRRSTCFGEKGFGLGVCGTWEPYKTNRHS